MWIFTGAKGDRLTHRWVSVNVAVKGFNVKKTVLSRTVTIQSAFIIPSLESQALIGLIKTHVWRKDSL